MKHELCSEQIVLRVAPTLRDELEWAASSEGRSLAIRILERRAADSSLPWTNNGTWEGRSLTSPSDLGPLTVLP